MIFGKSMSAQTISHPFDYNLGLKVVNGKNTSEITVCCHGYGASNTIVDAIKSYKVIDHTLIGFNFPDYNITDAQDHSKISYGSIREILPLLYVLKYSIDEFNPSKINLYGFSAGGGAVINALGILNTYSYKGELQSIGITENIAKTIINRLQQGIIILECPLKSIQEIIDFRGKTKNMCQMAESFNKNKMNPLDAIGLLKDLDLTILAYLETPDEVLGNRDDALLIKQLEQINNGKTVVVTGSAGGHCGYHPRLWNSYKKLAAK